ncbi:snaclec GPIB-binding protein subunit beta-like [Drosophila teissieri]|uniref:snaclec GPIB-binding protein subunit beta-like n=1 Tax=Drosophila teissieri TaxID=7243 RepID=UPI001CBA0BC1|nr:snaclec GPIB-binding protein subunit beta-like [Drosophila teissieri]
MDKRVLFVLTIFAVLFELQALTCPTEFTPVAGKCIFVSRNKVNWYTADRKCRKLGGSLLVFDSEFEKITITSHLLAIGVPFTGRWQDCIWVGIDSQGNGHNFVLSKNGDPPKYTPWAKKQPSGYYKDLCGSFANYRSWGYVNNECLFEALYVCETYGFYP